MGQITEFLKRSASQPEIYPLVAILGAAVGGIAFISVHQARAPDVVWNHKANPEPWQQVKDGERVKLAAVNQSYNGKFTRKEW